MCVRKGVAQPTFPMLKSMLKPKQLNNNNNNNNNINHENISSIASGNESESNKKEGDDGTTATATTAMNNEMRLQKIRALLQESAPRVVLPPNTYLPPPKVHAIAPPLSILLRTTQN